MWTKAAIQTRSSRKEVVVHPSLSPQRFANVVLSIFLIKLFPT